MKKYFLIFLFLPILMGTDTPAPPKVNFYNGPLQTALEQARQEGKMVFIDYYANWCSPCKFMDEYTFTDPELVRYTDENYVSVKINIDDFDGFAYKQQYGINLLPTLMVLDCKGKEIARREETMAASNLRGFLETHHNSSNLCPKPINIPEPTPPVVMEEEPTPPEVVEPTPPDFDPEPPSITEIEEPTPPVTNPAPPIVEDDPKPIVETKPKPSTDGLYRFRVERQASKGYSVQIGAFRQYGNVLREVERLQGQFPQPIIVFIGSFKGNTVYKILIGEFDSRAKAFSYQQHMKSKGVSGVIKNLAEMK